MSETMPPPLPNAPTRREHTEAAQRALTGTELARFEMEKKSPGIAFALCWMLGAWGAHRFYAGKPHAVTMVVITLITIPLCFVIVGFVSVFAVWIWMIVDLLSVSKWVKEYNSALLSRIT